MKHEKVKVFMVEVKEGNKLVLHKMFTDEREACNYASSCVVSPSLTATVKPMYTLKEFLR